MKKIFVISMLGVLAACTPFEVHLDDAVASRREIQYKNRDTNGCPFTDNNQEYRDCLLKTYYNNHPKTFVPARLEDGSAVMVVQDEKTSIYDEKTGTYKTERVIVIETTETKPEPVVVPEPVVEPEPVVVPEPVVEPEPVIVPEPKKDCSCNCCCEEKVVPAAPKPKKKPKIKMKTSVKTTVKPKHKKMKRVVKHKLPPVMGTEVVPVVEETPKQESWWERYQRERECEEEQPVCPCPDPNDPCPQCVEK